MLDFVRRRNLYYLLSLLVLLPGVISLVIPPGLKPGIEFSSGSMFEVSFQNTVAETDLRSEVASLGHPEARVQRTGQNRFLVRTAVLEGSTEQTPEGGPQSLGEQQSVTRSLFNKFGPMLKDDGSLATDATGQPIPWTVQSSAVSGTVSREIGRKAALAVAAASVAILLYITLGFPLHPEPVPLRNRRDDCHSPRRCPGHGRVLHLWQGVQHGSQHHVHHRPPYRHRLQRP